MKAPRKRRPESVYNPHWEAPDKEWLEHQLCVLGKSVEIVAEEVGANRKTVGNWLAEAGVTYWGLYKKSIPKGMVAPRYEVSLGGRATWHPPSKAWLVHQHHVLKKSVNKIAEELETDHDVVLRWLGRAGVERVHRYPKGAEHVNWKESGHSRPRSHARKVLREIGEPEVCSWCGQEPAPALGRRGAIEAHHKDHNPSNNAPENLMWLCHYCNLLEAYLWRLWKQDKIDLECENRTMVIRFKDKGE